MSEPHAVDSLRHADQAGQLYAELMQLRAAAKALVASVERISPTNDRLNWPEFLALKELANRP